LQACKKCHERTARKTAKWTSSAWNQKTHAYSIAASTHTCILYCIHYIVLYILHYIVLIISYCIVMARRGSRARVLHRRQHPHLLYNIHHILFFIFYNVKNIKKRIERRIYIYKRRFTQFACSVLNAVYGSKASLNTLSDRTARAAIRCSLHCIMQHYLIIWHGKCSPVARHALQGHERSVPRPMHH
jgi:hypothetical protein